LIAEMTSANPMSSVNERGKRMNSSGKTSCNNRRAGVAGFIAQ
jgi:hypothetical protein